MLSGAAHDGRLGEVRHALRAGADVNARGMCDGTSLMDAAYYGHVEVVSELIKHGANLNARDKHGNSALSHAVSRQHPAVADILLNAGAQCDDALAQVIAERYKGRLTKQQLRLNDDLVVAAKAGQVGEIERLLNNGADMSCRDLDTYTPLIWAVMNGHASAVETLLAKGAEVNAVDCYGKSALAYAVERGHWPLLTPILDRSPETTSQKLVEVVTRRFWYYDPAVLPVQEFLRCLIDGQMPDSIVRLALKTLYPCPACGYLVFDEPPGSYDVCPFCFWEDDRVQLIFPDMGGANTTLIQYQQNLSDPKAWRSEPLPGDIRDHEWRPIDTQKDRFLRSDDPPAEQPRPSEGACLYYWRRDYWLRNAH
jgi:hypothetical protein